MSFSDRKWCPFQKLSCWLWRSPGAKPENSNVFIIGNGRQSVMLVYDNNTVHFNATLLILTQQLPKQQIKKKRLLIHGAY